MILTLTPNPTIDQVIFVRDFRLDAAVRAERQVVTPSGKGVDASLVIQELGGRTIALGLKAGVTGRLHAALLDEWGIAHDFVAADGETRTAVVLVDVAVHRQSTISAPTLTATSDHLLGLLELLGRHGGHAWGLICGGSLPPGLPVDSYAHLLSDARERGLVTLLDSSGEALRQGVGGLPHILKVNLAELGALGIQSGSVDDPESIDLEALAAELAGQLGQWASDALIVTLGIQGALAVTKEGIYFVRPPDVLVSNTAGAGDALDGGVMLARSQGGDWRDALVLGTAAATSVVMNEGTAICRRKEVLALQSQVRFDVLKDSQEVVRR
ncbi:MAG: hexose kinase [Anaerolineae bacterium]|nr:hexose kinase [Anaerolineae bacterium]